MKNTNIPWQPNSLGINLFVFGSILSITYSLVLGLDKLGPIDVNGRNVDIIILRSQHPLGFFIAEAIILLFAILFYISSVYVVLNKIDIRFITFGKLKKLILLQITNNERNEGMKSLISKITGDITKFLYSFQNKNLFKVGSLTFAVDEKLQEEISDAFDFLKGIDADVYDKLMSFEAFFIHHYEKSLFGKPHYAVHESKVYTFTDNDIAWKKYGLIQRMYLVYLTSRKPRKEAYSELAEWCKSKGFPVSIVNHYEALASAESP